MPHHAADDTASWRADGVRHQILLRALPVQRHDVLGPLAVVRMALALMKRQASADAPDLPLLQSRLADTDRQVADAVHALSDLRWWDAGAGERRDAMPCISQCAALMRMAAGLHGHQLQGPERGDDLPPAGARPVPAPAVYYALLGLLMHVVDTLPSGRLLRLELGADRVTLRAQAPQPAPEPALPRPPVVPNRGARRSIDRQALGWLLDDLGWTLDDEADVWVLRWP